MGPLLSFGVCVHLPTYRLPSVTAADPYFPSLARARRLGFAVRRRRRRRPPLPNELELGLAHRRRVVGDGSRRPRRAQRPQPCVAARRSELGGLE